MTIHETTEQALAAWNNGDIVWSIEMGGMGPGYEQAIHIAAFEAIRYMLKTPPDWEEIDSDTEHEDMPHEMRAWAKYRKIMDEELFADDGPLKDAGMSGAQMGAAMNIASMFVKQGYKAAMDKCPEDRKIMVSNKWPTTEKEESHGQ